MTILSTFLTTRHLLETSHQNELYSTTVVLRKTAELGESGFSRESRPEEKFD